MRLPSAARIEPGAMSRRAQPKASLPCTRHSARWREEKGLPLSGSTAVSLASRKATGSRPSRQAISSTALSNAKAAGCSKGARM